MCDAFLRAADGAGAHVAAPSFFTCLADSDAAHMLATGRVEGVLRRVAVRHHRRLEEDGELLLRAALAVGALGVVTEESSRYITGEFSYTFSESTRPVEDVDSVCVHPLFMYRWFDHHAIQRMRGERAVYPYGTFDDPFSA